MIGFVAVLVVVLLASASAFHVHGRLGSAALKSAVAKKTQLNMAPAELAVQATSSLAQLSSQLVAAEQDFGGYAGPAGSLLLIGFIILTLAPPLAQKESD